MRILFLSPRQVLPARSGAKLREYYFLRALGKWAEVTHVYFSDPGAAPLTKVDLPFCHEVVAAPKPAAYGLSKTIQGVVRRWPLPILNYTSTAMSSTIARLTEGNSFDIIHVESIHMIRYALAEVKRNPKARTIYNWHNVESEAMRRYSGSAVSALRGQYARLTATKLETLERLILRSAFGHVVCSDRERDDLRRQTPAARIATVGNGVDAAYFAGAEAGSGERRRLVFVGAMDYFPNTDAAVFFATQIWPGIRKRAENVELAIVGSNPGPAVKALENIPGVEVTGTVPDVRPFYQNALAAVVPLRTGGGTRLKILEAMAAGTPVVSTPLGAEGLDVTDGANILLVDAEDAQGWADRIVSLAEQPARRLELTSAARALMEERYDWNLLGNKLVATYRGWLEDERDR